jgi:hypothetical protein
MKNPSLIIKPLMMKRCGSNMSRKKSSKKKKKNHEEVQHVVNLDETSVSIFPLDKDEVVQTYFPPALKYEEIINLNDAYDFVEVLPNTVEQHIDDFIQIIRHRWDVGFIFYRDPIYDIEGSSQEKRV